MIKYLLVAGGGALGVMLRYLVSGFIHRQTASIFPWGTLGVNVTGCFLAGFLWEIFERTLLSSDARLFVFIGVLGGYTTFSSFGLESFNLLRDGQMKLAFFNVMANNILCLSCIYVGFVVSRSLLNLFK